LGEGFALAARVADQASGDEILLTQAVADALGPDASGPELPLERLRPRRLDGLPGRHHLLRLLD
jgi:class 3 adenylate cyclase